MWLYKEYNYSKNNQIETTHSKRCNFLTSKITFGCMSLLIYELSQVKMTSKVLPKGPQYIHLYDIVGHLANK